MRLRSLLITFAIAWLGPQCSDENKPDLKAPSTEGVSGFVQKGPFISGSNIIVQVLDEEFNPTGQSYTVTTIDDFGSFTLASTITGTYVEFIAQGYYFNEVSGNISSSSLTLRALATVEEDLKTNINVLTTLSKNRIIKLVKEGLAFAEAKAQAEREILAAFNIPFDVSYDFNKMDMRANGMQDAVLLAISSIVQGTLNVGQLSELISKIIIDVEDDGVLGNASTINTLRENAVYLNVGQIRTNLIMRYNDLGLAPVIPPFELFVKRLVALEIIKTMPLSDEAQVRYDLPLVSVYFNKAIDGETINLNSFQLLVQGGGAVDGDILYKPDSFKIEFIPSDELLPETAYTVVITDDIVGIDAVPFAGLEFDFTTLDIDIVSNLLAYFPFNSDASDASGNNYHATAVNVTYGSDIEGQNGNACTFSGEGSYLEIPNVMNLSARRWTYSLWIHLDELPAGVAPFLLATRLSANTFWDVPLYIRPSVKSITTYNETVLEVTNFIETKKWYHVAMVIDSGSIAMYVDGQLKATKNNFWSHQSNPGYEDFEGDAYGSYEFYTGKYYISERFRGESFPAYMYGSVDNVRFYSRALNKFEIDKLFEERK